MSANALSRVYRKLSGLVAGKIEDQNRIDLYGQADEHLEKAKAEVKALMDIMDTLAGHDRMCFMRRMFVDIFAQLDAEVPVVPGQKKEAV